MARALSPSEAGRIKKKTLKFTGAWADAFGEPEATGVWFIWGQSGNGKSSFVMQLAKELCKFGRVAYDSLEEGISLSLQNTLDRHEMRTVDKRLLLLNRESMEDLEVRMERHRSPQFYIIDSFQYTHMSAKDYYEFVARHRNKLLISISHADGSKPDGRPAKKVMYDADQKILIEGFKAISKGRFLGPKREFVIWEEGAARYWGRTSEQVAVNNE